MQFNGKRFFVLAFLLFEASFAFYIFNYTAQNKKALIVIEGQEGITCADASQECEVLVIGREDGSIAYFKRGDTTPFWEYSGINGIESIRVSAMGEVTTASDSNHTLLFFMDIPKISEGRVVPNWTMDFDSDFKILDVYTYRSKVFSHSYIAVSSGGSIQVYPQTEAAPLWEINVGTLDVKADISHDGRWVAVAADNTVRLLESDTGEERWNLKLPSKISQVEISIDNGFIALGTDEGEKSTLYVVKMANGQTIWEHEMECPVVKLSASGLLKRLSAQTEDGRLHIYAFDGVEAEAVKVLEECDVWARPPFGPYLVTSSPSDRISYHFLERPAPLWSNDEAKGVKEIFTSLAGEYIYMIDKENIYMFTNHFYNELIPGSRTAWALFFSIGFAGLVSLTYLYRRVPWRPVQRGGVVSLVSGGSLGVLLFLLGSGKSSLDALPALTGCAVASWFYWRGKGSLGSAVLAYIAGLSCSILSGMMDGLLHWFEGSLSNIVFLVIDGGTEGVVIGLNYTLAGLVCGAIIRRLFPYEPHKK